MESYVINGCKRLEGSVRISSAKNSVLPIIAGSILTKEQVVIKNCPKITDVLSMLRILNSLGVKTNFQGDNLIIDSRAINDCVIPCDMSKELRSSVFMMGALLSRLNRAKLSYPGGCDIGLRPIDLHLSALKSLGVNVIEKNGEIECLSTEIKGREIFLDFPSVGATENIMLASVFCKGKTEIHNPAKEPEIIDLMCFLNSMGAKIYGAGTSTILIEGVKKLNGTEYLPIPDRIEAGTYLIAAAITGGEIEITNCKIKNISSLIHKLCNNTCKITLNNDIIYLKSGVVKKSFDFTTAPYPGFPTDLQPQALALATVSDGVSLITENVFEMRFKHVPELIRMGADITVKGRTAKVRGVERLMGADVYATDLRGGAALTLAGLAAEGTTRVYGVNHVERGYFEFEKNLRALGADIVKEG